jgi:hypothetical protein
VPAQGQRAYRRSIKENRIADASAYGGSRLPVALQRHDCISEAWRRPRLRPSKRMFERDHVCRGLIDNLVPGALEQSEYRGLTGAWCAS